MKKMYYPSIHVSYVDYAYLNGWDVPDQTMPFWRFYWNREEHTYVMLDDKHVILNPDCFYLVPAHTKYSSGCDQPFHHFYIHFFLSWRYEEGVFEYPLKPWMRRHIERIVRLRNKKNPDTEAESALLSYPLVSYALSYLNFADFKTEVSDSMQKTVQYIRDNCEKKVGNDELAKIAGMNTSAYVRKFKSHYKVSPHKFLNMVRCNRASFLMKYPELSMDDIAEKTGFCDRYHFSRVYKSIRMISPAMHRKQMFGEV